MQVLTPDDFPMAFAAAWMARDGNAIGQLFVPDADFVNVVGIWWEDSSAIAKAHSYALNSFFSKSRLAAGRIKTRMLGEDFAVVHARFRLMGQLNPDGTEAGARTTILSFVLTRTEGAWRAVSAQNTDIVPGMETYRSGDNGLTPMDYRD